MNIQLSRRVFFLCILNNKMTDKWFYGPAVQHSSELIEHPGSSIGDARSDSG